MRELAKRNEFYLSVIILAAAVVIGALNRAFFSVGTLTDMCRSATVYGVFAVGAMLVILSGGIDVSFPAIATISSYAALLAFPAGEGEGAFLPFLLTALLIGLGLGLVNGLFIAWLEFPPLIVTLATSSIYYGVQYTFLGSNRITRVPDYLTRLSRASLVSFREGTMTYNLPATFLFFVAVALLGWLLLRFTLAGRGIAAIGGNKNAAMRVGFRVKSLQCLVYGSAGLLAALGGVIYCASTRQGDPAALLGMDMTIISIVVLGGIDISGGKGSVTGLLLGLLFVTLINNSLILVGLSSQWHTLILGAAMFANAAITAWRGKQASLKVKEVEWDEDR